MKCQRLRKGRINFVFWGLNAGGRNQCLVWVCMHGQDQCLTHHTAKTIILHLYTHLIPPPLSLSHTNMHAQSYLPTVSNGKDLHIPALLPTTVFHSVCWRVVWWAGENAVSVERTVVRMTLISMKTSVALVRTVLKASSGITWATDWQHMR